MTLPDESILKAGSSLPSLIMMTPETCCNLITTIPEFDRPVLASADDDGQMEETLLICPSMVCMQDVLR